MNQRLGSLPTKSRAEILPRCRRDYPLLPPINRLSVDGLREEQNWVQIRRKTSHLPCFSSFSAVSLSLLSPSQSCLHPPPPFSPPARQPSSPPHFSLSTNASPFSSTAAVAHQHRHFHFLPSPAPVAATSAPTSTSTTGFTTIISINPAPHQWQSSHRDLLSLLLPTFLSPL